MNLLKTVGKGLLYIIALPFFLIVLALGAIFGIFLLIYMFFKSVILFFTGRSLNDDLPEDRMVKELRGGQNSSQKKDTSIFDEDEDEKPSTQEYDMNVFNNPSPIDGMVFGSKIIDDKPVEEDVYETIDSKEEIDDISNNIFNEPSNEEETTSKEIIEKEDIEEIKINQYIPRNNQSRFIDEQDNDNELYNDDSGVSISYGDDDD